MTARRAKLSLDPKRHTKAPPPHGFDAPETASAEQSQAPDDAATGLGASAGAGAARRRAAGWQAHRPVPAEPSAAMAGAEASGGSPAERDGAIAAHGADTWLAQAAALSRHPAVRALAVGVVTGLSLYLLRRRLF
jgi:hypothetical protein